MMMMVAVKNSGGGRPDRKIIGRICSPLRIIIFLWMLSVIFIQMSRPDWRTFTQVRYGR